MVSKPGCKLFSYLLCVRDTFIYISLYTRYIKHIVCVPLYLPVPVFRISFRLNQGMSATLTYHIRIYKLMDGCLYNHA